MDINKNIQCYKPALLRIHRFDNMLYFHIQNCLNYLQRQCECTTPYGHRQFTPMLLPSSDELQIGTRVVLRCKGEESERVFLPTMHSIKYKLERRLHSKTSYGSRFYSQKLTLGELYHGDQLQRTSPLY